MSPNAKANIRLGAQSLINNAACVELGRHKPWYGAVISAVLAVLLAITPIMVNNFKVKGGDNFFGAYTFGYEEGLVHFQDAIEAKGVSIKVDTEAKELKVDGWDNFKQTGEPYDITWYRHVNTSTDPANPYIDFEAYYINGDDDYFKTAVDNILSCKTPTGIQRYAEYTKPTEYGSMMHSEKREVSETSEAPSSTEESVASSESSTAPVTPTYKTNVLILGNTKFTAYKFSTSSTQGTGGYVYLYDRGESFTFNEKFKKDSTMTQSAYVEHVENCWRTFMNDAYETNKNNAAWINIGIMSGVFTIFIVLMGLLVFLMTRGKSNPFRIYTFWECQKIAYWASFTPGVLALALGFIPLFSTYTMFLFIFLFGMRLMWLSMKTLRPDATPSK